MAKTIAEFAEWLDLHPKAIVVVSEDIGTLTRANLELADKASGLRVSKYLESGTILGMDDPYVQALPKAWMPRIDDRGPMPTLWPKPPA